MNVDYQVITFKNQIKPKDIGGLGVELNDRKGSGNYNKEKIGRASCRERV